MRESDRRQLMSPYDQEAAIAAIWTRPDHQDDGWKYWAKSKRLRLWYFNPNGAGMLFAELGVLAVALLLLRRKLAIAIGGALLLPAVWGMVASGSRGSVLAFVLASVLMGGFSLFRSSFSKRRLVFVLGLVGLLVATVLVSVTVSRGSMFKLSASNRQRLAAWQAAPSMMVSAPDGWGDSPGYAYCNWFQKSNDLHVIRWLVNSHLTWLVQYGTAFRVVYLFGWFLVLGASLWGAVRGRRLLPLGECVAFGLGLWFSTVGIFASLWILPALSMLSLAWPPKRPSLRGFAGLLLTAAVLAAGTLFAVHAFGSRTRSSRGRTVAVIRTADGVRIGSGETGAYLVHDGHALTGDMEGMVGKELRKHFSRHRRAPAVVVADGLEGLPPRMERLVLAGRSARSYLRAWKDPARRETLARARKTIFLSPPFPPSAVPEDLRKQSEVTVLTGEFAAESVGGYECPPDWVTVVKGAALYIPHWTEKVLE